jgi:hypothetical protein
MRNKSTAHSIATFFYAATYTVLSVTLRWGHYPFWYQFYLNITWFQVLSGSAVDAKGST